MVLGGIYLAGYGFGANAGKPLPWLLVTGILFLVVGHHEQMQRLKERVGQLEKANHVFLDSQQRAWEAWTQSQGPEGKNKDMADALHRFALIRAELGEHDKAEPLYQRALSLWEQALGPESEEVAGCLSNLAILYLSQERYGEAEPLFRQALAIREKVLGAEHPEVAFSLTNLASHYHAQGNDSEAERFQQRAVSSWERILGQDHPDLITHLEYDATLLRRLKRTSEARSVEERVKAIREKQRATKTAQAMS